jgi:hypothetical protein
MSEKSESVQSESASAHVMSAGEMAHECGTDPKTFRRFLRASMRAQGRGDALPGLGRRYALSSADVETYRRLFASWERRSGGATFIDASSLDVSGDDS